MSRTTFKRKIRELEARKGSERIIERYKLLVERHSKKEEMREIAEDKGALLIAVFDERLNPTLNRATPDEFHPALAEGAVRSMDILEKFMVSFPGDGNIADDYVSAVEAIGGITHSRNYRENIVPILKTSLGIIERFSLDDADALSAKLYVLASSVDNAASMISTLEKYRIFEKEDGAVRIHSPREELIGIYLNRGLTALGESGDYETADRILGLLEKTDGKIVEAIERGRGFHSANSLVVLNMIKESEKMARLIGEGKVKIGGNIEKTEQDRGGKKLAPVINLADLRK